jgi:hypothetical protein
MSFGVTTLAGPSSSTTRLPCQVCCSRLAARRPISAVAIIGTSGCRKLGTVPALAEAALSRGCASIDKDVICSTGTPDATSAVIDIWICQRCVSIVRAVRARRPLRGVLRPVVAPFCAASCFAHEAGIGIAVRRDRVQGNPLQGGALALVLPAGDFARWGQQPGQVPARRNRDLHRPVECFERPNTPARVFCL